LQKLQEQKEIAASGPVSGTVAPVFLVNVNSALELDKLLASLSVWPRMETDVIPLTTFDDRKQSLLSRFEGLKTQAREMSAVRGSQ